MRIVQGTGGEKSEEVPHGLMAGALVFGLGGPI